MFHSDWAQDCTFLRGSCWDSVAGKFRRSPPRSSAWVLPTLMVKRWALPILPEGNLCYKAQNCQLCTGSLVRLLTFRLDSEISERQLKKNPNNKTQKYFLKNPPPPPNFSLLCLKKIQVDGCEIPGSERGIRKWSPNSKQWTSSLFQNIREKEKEISGQKLPAELKCPLHGKDKHTINTTFEFILSTPLNYINGNHDLDISIAVLF